MLESGQALSARFTLIRRLGAGGGGEVWLGQDRERQRLVALKVLADALTSNAAAIAALARECAQCKVLDHPNILRIDGVYQSADHVWIAMEYAGGGDLTQLRGGNAFEIVRAVIPIAAALAYAHRIGVMHRDVKPANVLFSADGAPRLADFGMTLTVAAAPACDAGRGSLYTMSPQQLEGEPASASDDVYGFGAMLYELLKGYPPFYPHATAQRIHRESPAALPASTPAPIARLIGRMLAKAADARPDMQAVERQLSAALATLPAPSIMKNEPTSVRMEPPAPGPQDMQGEPLRGEWRRPTGGGGGNAELRREGFRRGMGAAALGLGVAGVAIVFFALPRWVGEQPARYLPAASTVKPTALAPEKTQEIDFAELARARQQAQEARTAIDERLQQLAARAAAQWGDAQYQSATGELAAGDAAYQKRDYLVAAQHFTRIAPLLKTLEKRAGEVLREQLQAGAEAQEQGRSGDAKAAFGLALKIDPVHQAAAHGLKRAGKLDEVLKRVADAERFEKEDDVNAALANFRKALALDAQTQRAAAGAARLEARLAGDAFARAMARGFSALQNAEYASARSAFEAARKLRQGAPEIAQALRQLEQEQRSGVIAAKLANAQMLETQERWADALKEYRAIIELDSTVAAGAAGVARVAPRATLNEQLELYLTQPERLFSRPVRAAAHATLASANSMANPGPLLKQQTATLSDWVIRAETPVQVALQSDNLTQVTIYRVGELGAFSQRSLELAPGNYTVVGTRPGYRDVRREIRVAPDAAPDPVVIRCEDRI